MDDIKIWLNGPKDYNAGARLYLMYGKNHALRRVFSEPESIFKKKRLAEALKDLVIKKTVVTKTVLVEKDQAVVHVSVSHKKWPKQRDEILEALHQKWLPLFSEMMNITSRIYDVAKASDEPETQIGELLWLKNLGFCVESNFLVCKNIEEVITFWKKWDKKKDKQDKKDIENKNKKEEQQPQMNKEQAEKMLNALNYLWLFI